MQEFENWNENIRILRAAAIRGGKIWARISLDKRTRLVDTLMRRDASFFRYL